MCVCELAAALDMTQPNVTYHMKKLENVGLVEHEKRGKWVYYSLADEERLQRLGII
jgi:ArsR family transcriptional regulator